MSISVCTPTKRQFLDHVPACPLRYTAADDDDDDHERRCVEERSNGEVIGGALVMMKVHEASRGH